MGYRIRRIAAIVALLSGVAMASAQEARPVEYIVSLPRPQTQTLEMTMIVPGVTGPTLDVALPVWRPGRYALIDAAGTVSHVEAVTRSGQELPIEKIDKSTWRIRTLGATEIRVSYRVYANSINDRTRHVDDTHAFLSPAAVFMYAPTKRAEPVRVSVEAPEGWRTATGLERAAEGTATFAAPDYDVLVDSPLEIGLHDLIEFDVDGVPHEIAIWHAGATDATKPEYDAERLKRDFAAIVRAEAAIFTGSDGGRPEADVKAGMPYTRFVFLVHAGPGLGGGTEHLNSTIMQTGRASLEDDDAYRRFLGLVSHEMFHTWNVKQLRPADLKPYDYAHEDYTRLLWVAEGTTSYYDDLCLVRAGLMSPDKYLDVLGTLITGELERPGGGVQSLEESSFDAWIKFNRTTPDSPNTTVSFYTKGALISWLLDMEIRGRTGNAASLDTVMRTMYQRFPLAGPGYTTEDLLAVINEVSGSDFAEFFADYVAGTKIPDVTETLAVVGLERVFEPEEDETEHGEGDGEKKDSRDAARASAKDAGSASTAPPRKKAWLGLTLADRGERTVVTGALEGNPAYDAGIIADDEVIALDGLRLRAADLDKRLKHHNPGDRVTLTLMRRDQLKTIEVTLVGRPAGKWTIQRHKDAAEGEREAYKSWLGQGWPEEKKKDREDGPRRERF
jgi:predicted metalloprotease with PDZ domain